MFDLVALTRRRIDLRRVRQLALAASMSPPLDQNITNTVRPTYTPFTKAQTTV